MRRKGFLLAHRVRRIRNRPFSLLKMLTQERRLSCVAKKNFLLTIRLSFLSRDTRLTGLSFFSLKCSKTIINHLSYFLNQSRAVIEKKIFEQIFALFLLTARRAKGKLKERVFHLEKKKVVYLDWTALCKRARYKTKEGRGMEYAGEFYDTRVKAPVRGYGLLLAGLSLTSGDLLPLSFRLYSNRYISHHPEEKSINKMEESLMREVKEEFSSSIIFVGDGAFSKKMYLHIIKEDLKENFIVKAKTRVNVEEKKKGWKNVLLIAESIRKTYPVTWENQERGKFFLKAKFFEANLFSKKDKKSLPIFVILLSEKDKEDEPLILFTSLEVTRKNLQEIISIYNGRGRIDTLFEILKQSFGLERIMVRGWKGINIMIMSCLLSFVLSLCMFLTATKITFSTIKEFCQRKSVLKKKKVTIGKFYWATTQLSRSPPYYS